MSPNAPSNGPARSTLRIPDVGGCHGGHIMRLMSRMACACVSFAFVHVAFASSGQAGVRPGVEIGLSRSSLSYDDDDGFPFQYWDRGWRNSFTGGVSLELPFSEKVGL